MLIELKRYTKVLRGTTVLNNVSFALKSGRIYGLKGKNGSGKTMLLRALAGLIYPTSGEILFDGSPLARGKFPPSVGVLIENPSFVSVYSGTRNLRELALIRGFIGDREVADAMRSVGLDPQDKRPVRKYSLGMRQRLGIAAATMEHPDLMLLDEPVNALDESGVEQACRLFSQERERGALIVIACHDSAEVESLFDETFLMAEGHLKPLARCQSGKSW